MSSQPSSGSNYVDVQHAIIFDVFGDDYGVVVSFVSGQGQIVDDCGETADPLCFSMEFFPEDEYSKLIFIDVLNFWGERNDPIDISIVDSKSIIYNSALDTTMEIYCD